MRSIAREQNVFDCLPGDHNDDENNVTVSYSFAHSGFYSWNPLVVFPNKDLELPETMMTQPLQLEQEPVL